MKTYREIKKIQDELDNEFIKCPRCLNETKWLEIQKFGVCGDCAEKDMKRLEDDNIDQKIDTWKEEKIGR
jgi:hypothetical protein